MQDKLDLSCFSYLASAQVLQIQKYPELNGGAEILNVIETLAADAPMTAIVASRLGLSVGLISNQLGDDSSGREIVETLRKNKIVNSIKNITGQKTPFINVLSDKDGNREWLAYIKDAEKSLITTDLSQIKSASLVYIDLYEGIKESSLRAIDYASENGTPIFLNLSGNIPTQELISRLTNKNIEVVQIGLHESQESEAVSVVNSIYSTIKPQVAIVTLASRGAIAIDKNGIVKAAAYLVKMVHVHGAGAMFSGGFIFGYKKNWSLQKTLQFACATGSLGCSKERGYEDFNLEEINKLILTK